MTAPRLRAHDILEAVAAETGCSVSELLAFRRGYLTEPRQLAMWLARALTPQSLPQLGRAIGRDHTTVMHGVRRMEARLAESAALRALAARVLDRLDREFFAQARAARETAAVRELAAIAVERFNREVLARARAARGAS